MWMTDAEIAYSYTNAIKKNAQIRVIAELNACDAVSVIQALNRQGIRLDAKRASKARIVAGTGRLWVCDKEVKRREQEFHNALNRLLERHTQSELALICNIDRKMINKYALGHRLPSTAAFDKMLDGLKVTREEFFSMGEKKDDD